MAWLGEHVDYDKFKSFRFTSNYNINDTHQIDNRSKKSIFLGYVKKDKGFRLWSVNESELVTRRDVTFD